MSGHEMQGHTTDHTSVAEGHEHPSPKLYIQIAGILAGWGLTGGDPR